MRSFRYEERERKLTITVRDRRPFYEALGGVTIGPAWVKIELSPGETFPKLAGWVRRTDEYFDDKEKNWVWVGDVTPNDQRG